MSDRGGSPDSPVATRLAQASSLVERQDDPERLPCPIDSTDFRQRLVAEARTWAGTPFAWGQSSRAGCDCKGLLAGIAREVGLPEGQSPEALMVGDYHGRVPTSALRRGLLRLFDKVAAAAPADVLLMRFRGKPQHLAMYLGDDKLIHCHQRQRDPRARIERVRWADVDSVWGWRIG